MLALKDAIAAQVMMMPGQPPFPLNGSATYGSNAGIYSGSTAINSSNAGIFAGNSGIYASNADEFGGGEQMFVLFWMCMSLSSVLRTLVKVSQVRPLCTTALSVPGFAVSFIESLFHVLKSRGLVVFSFIEIRGLLVCLLGREHACQPFDPRHGRQNRVCRQHGLFAGGAVGDGERVSEAQTDTQTYTNRSTGTHTRTHAETQTHRHTDVKDTGTSTQTHRHTDIQTHRHGYIDAGTCVARQHRSGEKERVARCRGWSETPQFACPPRLGLIHDCACSLVAVRHCRLAGPHPHVARPVGSGICYLKEGC
eukprot:2888835-Rhodomonas_salina.2